MEDKGEAAMRKDRGSQLKSVEGEKERVGKSRPRLKASAGVATHWP